MLKFLYFYINSSKIQKKIGNFIKNSIKKSSFLKKYFFFQNKIIVLGKKKRKHQIKFFLTNFFANIMLKALKDINIFQNLLQNDVIPAHHFQRYPLLVLFKDEKNTYLNDEEENFLEKILSSDIYLTS